MIAGRVPLNILSMVAVAALAAAGESARAAPGKAERSAKATFVVETVARGLDTPWGLAFLPDGRFLVSERDGRLRTVAQDGRVSPAISGVPSVAAAGQGGLLDVVLDPQFADNRLLYISYAEPRDGRSAGTSVARARLSGDAGRLENVEVIFRQQPAHTGGNHFGSRLVFGRDGTLFVTLGERFDLRAGAQDLSTTLGKIVRIRTDGSTPPDNPFVDRPGADPTIWSYGHRNVQGAAINPASGELWTAEHGARGGDEINIPRKGRNYGWPVISYGVNYSGSKIGEGTAKAGMEQPVYYWDPSIAPSGMIFYTGTAFPAWRGSIFVGALAGQLVARLETEGDKVTREERLLTGLEERIRDVRQGPDGLIYLLTDSTEGRLLRLRPAG
ncbi:PQQ-dependent sugar dehydrogenase [Chelatococcus reniformis]|uniref:Glucose/Sorbosone dehydrogenase domain-containing protein n=1 Tax=Chelatococcus reniformis TaxID=1494448 RepID=A0A916XKY5_9HYPH|nr:PQQ-dependent sugar dehydrogenase [Chelatococcus reniformis]GGC82720.1 hypothetical protein GCM10010994_45780 [Chelatococcus reniformis]